MSDLVCECLHHIEVHALGDNCGPHARDGECLACDCSFFRPRRLKLWALTSPAHQWAYLTWAYDSVEAWQKRRQEPLEVCPRCPTLTVRVTDGDKLPQSLLEAHTDHLITPGQASEILNQLSDSSDSPGTNYV